MRLVTSTVLALALFALVPVTGLAAPKKSGTVNTSSCDEARNICGVNCGGTGNTKAICVTQCDQRYAECIGDVLGGNAARQGTKSPKQRPAAERP